MLQTDGTSILRLTEDAQAAFIAAARDREPVRGLTHRFYKYPARFSPVFARAAIEIFTDPGDLVMDPHVGGGTTLVEALASGREGVGIDISSLAEFVTHTKCIVFSEAELNTLSEWALVVAGAIDIHRPSRTLSDYADLGYYKHLDHPSRWRLRKAIEQALASAVALGTPHLDSFGRCVVLRTAQWSLDGRNKLPKVAEFRKCLGDTACDMVKGARDLRASVSRVGRQRVTVLRRSAAGVEGDQTLSSMRAPRLIITSPPYPGVHVLYHRWQVDGRKEAPVPFMIANKLDGAGSSYYTMGDRQNPGLRSYFENIRASISSVASVADEQTVFVQMVAFSDPNWQLHRYLETMEEAGLQEMFLPMLKGQGDGRLWRIVPRRRWYSDQRGETPGSKEVVLMHCKRNSSPSQLPNRQSPRLPTNLPDRASLGRA
jgi:DNA methylase